MNLPPMQQMKKASKSLNYLISKGRAKKFKTMLKTRLTGACEAHSLDLKCQPNYMQYEK